MASGKLFIGTSGWHYRHWIGPFYPAGMKPREFLPWYARQFQSVEINGTFYRLPTVQTLAKWRDETPEGFIFACKASRFITHMKKLKDPGARFFEAVRTLGPKLGPILFQLPPRWRLDAGRLAGFLDALPKGFRYAFEFHDRSWFSPEIYQLLEQHEAALCAYDLDRWRSPIKLTASLVYVRLHGPDGPYRGDYDGRALAGWARRIQTWREAGLDVYCYFDNDEAGYAALDAQRLADMVGRLSAGGASRRMVAG